MTHLNTLEVEIANAIIEFEKEAHVAHITGNGNWTNGIKKRLGELGCSKGFKVCDSHCDCLFEPEWLYDLIWYIENSSVKLNHIPLAVESEWDLHDDGIKYDFEKLLIANAELKLMICQVYPSRKEKVLQYFQEAIQAYELGKTGERFLIAILDTEEEIFDFTLLTRF